jgi:chaperonin GroES
MMNMPMNSETQEFPAMDETAQQGTKKTFRALVEEINIAESLDENKLNQIGEDCRRGYEIDKESRAEWEDSFDSWVKLAKQVQEERTFPWQGASNVKYPLMTTAAMQFAARAYPSLVPSNGQIVKARTIGKDMTGEKMELAHRVSMYMSYQIMHEIPYWEEEMDKMLIQLPVVGMMFKKTYWDSVKKVPISTLVSPKNLVVNYWTKNLKESERISEEIEMSARVLKERQLAKLFLDVDLGPAPLPEDSRASGADDTIPYVLIEQHTFLDLDDDGYNEPYIVTFHKETGKVLRIVARYDESGIFLNEDGDLVKLEPLQYYTKFGFVPNPDGSFYDIGFGCLLGPINESVNTLINQLVDAGSLNNLQSGFLGKGLRLRMGDYGFRPGEWKAVNAVGDDLKKQIVPLPSKEPSNVLFQLMGSLISSGKELASVAEIFTGKMPGQNTPATTTMATIEQGMKVFTAVYKRIFRSLAEEFEKIYDLNATYLNPQTYAAIVDVQVGPQDFSSKYDICPGADPTAVSQTEKLMKAQGLLELLPTGMLNPVEVIQRVLEAQEQPNWEQLLNPQVAQTGEPPAPPPDPKLMEMEMKGQLEQQKIQLQGQAQAHKMELESRDKQTQLAMKAREHQMDMAHKEQMGRLQAAEAIHKQRIFSAQAQADLNQKVVSGQQALVQKDAEHKQKLAQSKSQPKGATK